MAMTRALSFPNIVYYFDVFQALVITRLRSVFLLFWLKRLRAIKNG